jgi:hypothetical protein
VGAGLLGQLRFQGFNLCMCCLQQHQLLLLKDGFVITAKVSRRCCCCCYLGATFGAAVCRGAA